MISGLLVVGSCENKKSSITHKAEAMIYFTDQQEDGSFVVTGDPYGKATFTQQDDVIILEIETFHEMEKRQNAVHIHEGTCENPTIHWNRGEEGNYCRKDNLDQVWGRPRAGDIGNVVRREDGIGRLYIESEIWSLTKDDETNIIGLPIVIHRDYEDFAQECFENHSHVHNNPKIACGTIELLLDD